MRDIPEFYRKKKKMNARIFERNVPGTTEVLAQKCVAVAGCGGLGSNAAVSLVRAGVGKLVLADFDLVECSNLNRQHYFLPDVGEKKTEALEGHLKKINPEVRIVLYSGMLSPQNVCEILGEADLLIEAFDKAESKKWLLEAWCKRFPKKPVVCGSGLSGLGNTNELKVLKAGNVFFCGDGKTDMSMGLCSARVAIVANMQANIALEWLISDKPSHQGPLR